MCYERQREPFQSCSKLIDTGTTSMPQRSEPLEKEKWGADPSKSHGQGCSGATLSQRQPDLKEEASQDAAVLTHDIWSSRYLRHHEGPEGSIQYLSEIFTRAQIKGRRACQISSERLTYKVLGEVIQGKESANPWYAFWMTVWWSPDYYGWERVPNFS